MAPLSIGTLHAKPASQGTAPADRLDPLRNSGRRGRLTVPIGAHPQKSAMSQDRPAASVKLSRLINSSLRTQCTHFAHLQRSEEHTSELKSLMRNSYAVFCLKKKTTHTHNITTTQ